VRQMCGAITLWHRAVQVQNAEQHSTLLLVSRRFLSSGLRGHHATVPASTQLCRRLALAAGRACSCTGVFTGSAAARVILHALGFAAAPRTGDPRLRSRYPPTTSPSTRGVVLLLLLAALAIARHITVPTASRSEASCRSALCTQNARKPHRDDVKETSEESRLRTSRLGVKRASIATMKVLGEAFLQRPAQAACPAHCPHTCTRQAQRAPRAGA